MDDAFANLSPDDLQQLLSLSGLNQQDDLLRDQLAQAVALRNRPHQVHTSAIGGALGALGDVLNTYTSKTQEALKQAQLSGNADKEAGIRGLIINAMQGQQQPQPAASSIPPMLRKPDDSQPLSFNPFAFGGY